MWSRCQRYRVTKVKERVNEINGQNSEQHSAQCIKARSRTGPSDRSEIWSGCHKVRNVWRGRNSEVHISVYVWGQEIIESQRSVSLRVVWSKEVWGECILSLSAAYTDFSLAYTSYTERNKLLLFYLLLLFLFLSCHCQKLFIHLWHFPHCSDLDMIIVLLLLICYHCVSFWNSPSSHVPGAVCLFSVVIISEITAFSPFIQRHRHSVLSYEAAIWQLWDPLVMWIFLLFAACSAFWDSIKNNRWMVREVMAAEQGSRRWWMSLRVPGCCGDRWPPCTVPWSGSSVWGSASGRMIYLMATTGRYGWSYKDGARAWKLPK